MPHGAFHTFPVPEFSSLAFSASPLKHAIFPELSALQRFKTAKVTFSLTQGLRQSCHTWFPIIVFHYDCFYLAPFPRYCRLCSKIYMVTWPWPRPLDGLFANPKLILHMANQCKKIEVSGLCRSRDIIEDYKFKLSHVTWPCHFQQKSLSSAGTCYDQLSHQIWSLYFHPLRRYKRIWGGLGG